MEHPKIQRSQIVFGDIVYWVTIIAAMICIIGPVLSFAFMDSNVINPHQLFASMWDGKDPTAIWEEAGSETAGGHFWIHHLGSGDGLTQLGLVLGCSVAIPAMLATAVIYAFKEKSIGWAILALWITAMVTVSLLGIASF